MLTGQSPALLVDGKIGSVGNAEAEQVREVLLPGVGSETGDVELGLEEVRVRGRAGVVKVGFGVA